MEPKNIQLIRSELSVKRFAAKEISSKVQRFLSVSVYFVLITNFARSVYDTYNDPKFVTKLSSDSRMVREEQVPEAYFISYQFLK